MKLFLDTANVANVAEVASWGVLEGVTTSPSIVAKEEEALKKGLTFKQVVLQMCEHVPCVSAQVTATTADEMIAQGIDYASWHKHVVVKVPMTTEGLKVITALTAKNIKTNCTLVFSVSQAMLAAKAGAYIVSPFIGRLDERGEDGMKLVENIVLAFRNYSIKTQCLVASIRSVDHVQRAMLVGADIATIPYKILAEMPKHELTDIGLQKFMADWEKVKAAGAAA